MSRGIQVATEDCFIVCLVVANGAMISSGVFESPYSACDHYHLFRFNFMHKLIIASFPRGRAPLGNPDLVKRAFFFSERNLRNSAADILEYSDRFVNFFFGAAAKRKRW